ncbi:hypothetical protein SDC9_133289 [bioreactor metagenome]|uniref:Uncharacterized protein n=1 Tax=bioreactor metagenome TaxID=1076179 RepID=A0A645DA84_9ZZZZ
MPVSYHETNKNYSMDSYMSIEPVSIGPLWKGVLNIIFNYLNSLFMKKFYYRAF